MQLYFHCGPLKKTVVGYIDIKQQERILFTIWLDDLNNIWLEMRDTRLRIQYSRFKIEKEKYENAFQEKSTTFKNIKVCFHNSPVIKLLFHAKICALLRRKIP